MASALAGRSLVYTASGDVSISIFAVIVVKVIRFLLIPHVLAIFSDNDFPPKWDQGSGDLHTTISTPGSDLDSRDSHVSDSELGGKCTCNLAKIICDIGLESGYTQFN